MVAEKMISEKNRLGNYQLLNLLGKGRLAEVWLARQIQSGFTVALKVIADKQENKLIRQFEQEVESLARLEHPNILAPVDFGNTGKYLYLAMPLAQGGSLETKLRERQFSQTEAFELFDQLLDGLAFAHVNSVIHGDLKPANILFLSQHINRPVIADFGLANTLSLNEDIFLTLTGTITGSPEYMAPEQFMGQTLSASDQYAAALILFELLTGQRLFQGNTAWEIGMRHTNDPLPLPHPRIPASLEPFFTTALNKNPARRFRNTQEMRAVYYKSVNRLNQKSSAKPANVPTNTGFKRKEKTPKQVRSSPAVELTSKTGPVLPSRVNSPYQRPRKAKRNPQMLLNCLVLFMAVIILLLSLLLILQPQPFY